MSKQNLMRIFQPLAINLSADYTNLDDSITGIKNSNIYIGLITNGFVTDKQCMAELAYARRKKKPGILLVEQGLELSIDFFDGLDILYKVEIQLQDFSLDKIGPEIGKIINDFLRKDSEK